MLKELQDVKAHAEALLAMARAGLQHEEQHFVGLVAKVETAFHAPTEAAPAIGEQEIRDMVNRFLGWKLPATFGPDGGITFTPSNGMSREEAYEKPGWWPVGTNLLTADEATQMFRYVLGITGPAA